MFVDIAPDTDKAVCNNCKHISVWGVATGYCAVKHENRNLGQTCKKFEKK